MVQFRIWRDESHRREASGAGADELDEVSMERSSGTDALLRAGMSLGMPRIQWIQDIIVKAASESIAASASHSGLVSVQDLERSLRPENHGILECQIAGDGATVRAALDLLGPRFTRIQIADACRPCVPDCAPMEAMGGIELGSTVPTAPIALSSVSDDGSTCCTLHTDGTAVVWSCLTGQPTASWRAIESSDPAEAVARAAGAHLKLDLSGGVLNGRFAFVCFPCELYKP